MAMLQMAEFKTLTEALVLNQWALELKGYLVINKTHLSHLVCLFQRWEFNYRPYTHNDPSWVHEHLYGFKKTTFSTSIYSHKHYTLWKMTLDDIAKICRQTLNRPLMYSATLFLTAVKCDDCLYKTVKSSCTSNFETAVSEKCLHQPVFSLSHLLYLFLRDRTGEEGREE